MATTRKNSIVGIGSLPDSQSTTMRCLGRGKKHKHRGILPHQLILAETSDQEVGSLWNLGLKLLCHVSPFCDGPVVHPLRTRGTLESRKAKIATEDSGRSNS